MLAPELKDIKIQGDKATARNGKKQIKFVKVKGRWFYGE